MTSAMVDAARQGHGLQQRLADAVADGRVQGVGSLGIAGIGGWLLHGPAAARTGAVRRARRDGSATRSDWSGMVSYRLVRRSTSAASSRKPVSARPSSTGATTSRMVARPSSVRKTGSRPALPL